MLADETLLRELAAAHPRVKVAAKGIYTDARGGAKVFDSVMGLYSAKSGRAAADEDGTAGSGGPTVKEGADDPHRLARVFLREYTEGGTYTLRKYRSEWLVWCEGAYDAVDDEGFDCRLNAAVKEEFDRVFLREMAEWEASGGVSEDGKSAPAPVARKVTIPLVKNVSAALAGMVYVSADVEMPAWIDGDGPHPAREVIACRNGIVHVPSAAAGHGSALPHTPRLFTRTVLPFDFRREAGKPVRWLRFLEEVWQEDEQSAMLLQEWVGFILCPDMRQQKFLVTIGPPGSGKGTISRMIDHLLGSRNVCSVSLASLGTRFGREPLIGKALVKSADVRISDRAAQADVVETILSITGRDPLSIDRKNKSAVDCTLPINMMIFSNEIPELMDASAAIAGAC